MGKLGGYSYPEITLDEAISIASIVAVRLKGRVSRKGLAKVLNQSELSGWLSHKLAALKDFGLVQGRGEGTLTPLAERLAFPTNEDEAKRARSEAYGNVALFRALEGRFHRDVPDSGALTVALEQLTETPRYRVVKKVGLIRNHLSDASNVRGRPSTMKVTEKLMEGLIEDGIARGEGRDHKGIEEPIERNRSLGSVQFGMTQELGFGDDELGQMETAPTLQIMVGAFQMAGPLSNDNLDIAISMLEGLRRR